MLYPGERIPGTHWIGGWVSLRAGLDKRLEEKSFASTGDQILDVGDPVCSQTVYQRFPNFYTLSLT
jgi:hypothetical protein